MSVVFGELTMVITTAAGAQYNVQRAGDFASVYAETKSIAFSGENVYTFLDSLVPKIKNRVGAVGLVLEVYGHNRLEDEKRLLATLDLSLSDAQVHPAKPIESCVFYAFRLVDSTLTRQWKLSGFQLFGEPDGEYFL